MLRALGLAPGDVREAAPLPSILASAGIWRLTLTPQPEARRVVKVARPYGGWMGAASEDGAVREVRLWETGLLRDLPRQIDTAVLRTARSGERAREPWAALLLRDETAHLLRSPLTQPPGRLPTFVRAVLDALAAMHARYWQDARLRDPAHGLMSPTSALLFLSPDAMRARLEGSGTEVYLPLAVASWDRFFALATPADSLRLQESLARPDAWVRAIEALPATLVHGDVWGPNLGLLPSTAHAPRRGHRILLLDWALATAGPATYDPLWLCGTWHTLDPVPVLACYRARLARHLAARGLPLPAATWRALVDAGYLRTVLTCGEAFARTATTAPPGAARAQAEARVRWWAHRAAQAADRLAGYGDF